MYKPHTAHTNDIITMLCLHSPSVCVRMSGFKRRKKKKTQRTKRYTSIPIVTPLFK